MRQEIYLLKVQVEISGLQMRQYGPRADEELRKQMIKALADEMMELGFERMIAKEHAMNKDSMTFTLELNVEYVKHG